MAVQACQMSVSQFKDLKDSGWNFASYEEWEASPRKWEDYAVFPDGMSDADKTAFIERMKASRREAFRLVYGA